MDVGAAADRDRDRDRDPAPEGARSGPAWLEAFVEARYFGQCSKHRAGKGKSERNLFCTECREGPLCAAAVRERHAAHLTLQARKASYKDAVRVHDVARVLDISGIETYVINGAKIVFLHRRPQAKPPQGVPSCEVCRRSFRDHVRFCSIQCKMEAARTAAAGDATITMMHMAPPVPLPLPLPGPPQRPQALHGKPVTNFRVHGEQLVRNLTPPHNVWSNFLHQQQPEEQAIPKIPSSAMSSSSRPRDSRGFSSTGRTSAAAAAAAAGLGMDHDGGQQQQKQQQQEQEQQMRYKPQAIQHKGKRIVPLTGRQLLSQFSLNSWLMECNNNLKRKFDDTGATSFLGPPARGLGRPQDTDFTFLPPPPPVYVALPAPPRPCTSSASSIIIPRARRILIADTLPLLHSPTTSDLSSEAGRHSHTTAAAAAAVVSFNL